SLGQRRRRWRSRGRYDRSRPPPAGFVSPIVIVSGSGRLSVTQSAAPRGPPGIALSLGSFIGRLPPRWLRREGLGLQGRRGLSVRRLDRGSPARGIWYDAGASEAL